MVVLLFGALFLLKILTNEDSATFIPVLFLLDFWQWGHRYYYLGATTIRDLRVWSTYVSKCVCVHMHWKCYAAKCFRQLPNFKWPEIIMVQWCCLWWLFGHYYFGQDSVLRPLTTVGYKISRGDASLSNHSPLLLKLTQARTLNIQRKPRRK